MKLKDWIPMYNLDFNHLYHNNNAIDLLQCNQHLIDWHFRLSNHNMRDLLLNQYPYKIDWDELSNNPNAIDLLEKNKDNINWIGLFSNTSIFEPN